MEAENLPSSGLDFSWVNFLLWEALQQKVYQQELWDIDLWSAFCHTAGSNKS